ncbi:hypothetical protein Dda_1057 [Drechslerella dactyloides]|uniref:Uncharacterized protein n=1 Tax=Drechslerella dactyloides TaxID=74499 RepID=A0AAD6J769_DREDA|nr:hypothetical protein Dda_1057 [Drechslerella dactyloides]
MNCLAAHPPRSLRTLNVEIGWCSSDEQTAEATKLDSIIYPKGLTTIRFTYQPSLSTFHSFSNLLNMFGQNADTLTKVKLTIKAWPSTFSFAVCSNVKTGAGHTVPQCGAVNIILTTENGDNLVKRSRMKQDLAVYHDRDHMTSLKSIEIVYPYFLPLWIDYIRSRKWPLYWYKYLVEPWVEALVKRERGFEFGIVTKGGPRIINYKDVTRLSEQKEELAMLAATATKELDDILKESEG